MDPHYCHNPGCYQLIGGLGVPITENVNGVTYYFCSIPCFQQWSDQEFEEVQHVMFF